MKRVCTLRKVLLSLSKVLLEKLFYRSNILWLFMTTQFLSSLKYLQPGDFSCCKYRHIFRNLQVFEHFFSKKGYFSYVFY
jgi:hypothetical protein